MCGVSTHTNAYVFVGRLLPLQGMAAANLVWLCGVSASIASHYLCTRSFPMTEQPGRIWGQITLSIRSTWGSAVPFIVPDHHDLSAGCRTRPPSHACNLSVARRPQIHMGSAVFTVNSVSLSPHNGCQIEGHYRPLRWVWRNLPPGGMIGLAQAWELM